MTRRASSVRWWMLLIAGCALAVACVTAVLSVHHRQHQPAAFAALPAAFPGIMPQRVLWAWEEPEDLHTLSPTVGVAYLAETILLSDHLTVLPRRQPLIPAAGASLMAVVRIETRPGFADTPELRAAGASHLATVSARGGVRAFQIDFDATASQRAFYAGLLTSLRPQLPPGMPLSITALVSWCGPDSWLHTLPIDEAVPMFFRMGGPRALAATAPRSSAVTEPLCRTSLGLTTDEPWPHTVASLNPATRVYLFAPKPWQPRQLTAVAEVPVASLAQELTP